MRAILSWAEFEKNQHLIAENANGKSYMGRGSIRRGEALLPGLFRCARCGRRLHIHYTGKGGNTQRYALPRDVQHQSGRQLHRIRRHADRSNRRARSPGSVATSRDRGGAGRDGIAQGAIGNTTSASRSRTLSSRPSSRPLGHVDNTTPSIRTIAWLPVSWSGVGTRSWYNCTIWRCSSTT